MQREGSYLSNAEILAFFRRVDKNNTSRISYQEFKAYVLPPVSSLRKEAAPSTNQSKSADPTYDYLAYNPNKYSIPHTSNILQPANLSREYTEHKPSSPYKKTPYLSEVGPHDYADSYGKALNTFNRTSTGSPLTHTGPRSDFLQSHNLPRPQVPKNSYFSAERPTELLKYRDFYPHTSGKYFEDYYYPFVRRYLYYPLKYDSKHATTPVQPTSFYNSSQYYPYSSHRYYPDYFHPTLTAGRETEGRFLPDPTGYKRSYDEIPKYDHKYVAMRDLYYYPKMSELKYRRTADDSFYSSTYNKKFGSPQQELGLTRKLDDWKQFSKAYDDNYVNYGSSKNIWTDKNAKNDDLLKSSYNFGSTATGNLSSTQGRSGAFSSTNRQTPSRLYDADDLKKKYGQIKDHSYGNYQFARSYA